MVGLTVYRLMIAPHLPPPYPPPPLPPPPPPPPPPAPPPPPPPPPSQACHTNVLENIIAFEREAIANLSRFERDLFKKYFPGTSLVGLRRRRPRAFPVTCTDPSHHAHGRAAGNCRSARRDKRPVRGGAGSATVCRHRAEYRLILRPALLLRRFKTDQRSIETLTRAMTRPMTRPVDREASVNLTPYTQSPPQRHSS